MKISVNSFSSPASNTSSRVSLRVSNARDGDFGLAAAVALVFNLEGDVGKRAGGDGQVLRHFDHFNVGVFDDYGQGVLAQDIARRVIEIGDDFLAAAG